MNHEKGDILDNNSRHFVLLNQLPVLDHGLIGEQCWVHQVFYILLKMQLAELLSQTFFINVGGKLKISSNRKIIHMQNIDLTLPPILCKLQIQYVQRSCGGMIFIQTFRHKMQRNNVERIICIYLSSHHLVLSANTSEISIIMSASASPSQPDYRKRTRGKTRSSSKQRLSTGENRTHSRERFFYIVVQTCIFMAEMLHVSIYSTQHFHLVVMLSR